MTLITTLACRAVYQNADIYLLDDPLSSVDASVGEHILKECILGLLKLKIVLLVTHSTHHLPYASRILIMESGTIKIEGTYDELFRVGEIRKEFNNDGLDEPFSAAQEATPAVPDSKSKDPKVMREVAGRGHVGWSLLWTYLRFGNGFIFIAITGLSAVANQICLSGTDLMLQIW